MHVPGIAGKQEQLGVRHPLPRRSACYVRIQTVVSDFESSRWDPSLMDAARAHLEAWPFLQGDISRSGDRGRGGSGGELEMDVASGAICRCLWLDCRVL
jgi:hypothetical protein